MDYRVCESCGHDVPGDLCEVVDNAWQHLAFRCENWLWCGLRALAAVA